MRNIGGNIDGEYWWEILVEILAGNIGGCWWMEVPQQPGEGSGQGCIIHNLRSGGRIGKERGGENGKEMTTQIIFMIE